MKSNRIIPVAIALFLVTISSLAGAPLTMEDWVKAKEARERMHLVRSICPEENSQPRALSEAILPGDSIPPSERAALIALYNSTNGANWIRNDNWLGPEGTEGTWYGISLDNDSHVGSLYLAWNQLSGSIPSELGDLVSLTQLFLHGNSLEGPIPPSLGNMTNLQTLYLGWNPLTGNIPAELGNLTQLRDLEIENTSIEGPIPPEIGQLANLDHLFLWHNNLSGPIPSELGNLTELTWLVLSMNQLSGPIPAQLSNLTKAWALDLDINLLSGEIPTQLCTLPNLERLGLWSNQLTGSIPPELGGMTKLRELELADNKLTGSIPCELVNARQLVSLYLSGNPLDPAPMPECLQDLPSRIRQLLLGDVNLTGEIPPWLSRFAELSALSLEKNHLAGALPAYLGNFQNMQQLMLDGNMFSGEIPGSFSNLKKIQPSQLGLAWNALFTDDPALATFLDSLDGYFGWRDHQTVPPTGLTAVPLSPNAIRLRWSQEENLDLASGYRVFVGTSAGGPYTCLASLTGAGQDEYLATSLDAGTRYFFNVQTFTSPHFFNPNTVTSVPSQDAVAMTAVTLPGDCDGDGSISIGDVQKAINMFLGTQAPGCGVDCNGDGQVSIGEVQKVINAFLGLASSC